MTIANTSGSYSGTGNFSSGTFPGPGLIPLGGIVATFPHLSGAYSTVATTAPDSNGFVLCQGQTLASGPMAGAVVPNINNNVFLRGATFSANTINSSATRTLVAGNIPSLTSTGTVTGTGTTVATNTGAGGSHTHTVSGNTNIDGLHNHDATIYNNTNPGGGTFLTGNSTSVNPYNYQTADAPASAHYHGISLVTGPEAAHIHPIPSLQVNSGQSVSVSYTNSASSFNIEPAYISAVYLMRVS